MFSDIVQSVIVCPLQIPPPAADRPSAELTLRLVDREESRELNRRYRGKDSATNVLSFPAELPEALDLPLLGDVVICAPLVAEQAREQGKPVDAHWAHLVIHGILHLLGYDHEQPAAEREMKAREAEIFSRIKSDEGEGLNHSN